MIKNFIDWRLLRNPIYFKEGWSVKDACMVTRNDIFFIFFSAFYHERGRERSHIIGIKTRDWKVFSEPFLELDGRDGGWTGMCSPNITSVQHGNNQIEYYMTFNSWGHKHPNGGKNSLFGMKSVDLEHWTKIFPIGRNINSTIPKIDIAVHPANGKFYLIWKEMAPNRNNWKVKLKKSLLRNKKERFAYRKSRRWTMVGTTRDLAGDIDLIDGGRARFYMEDGQESKKIQENYQMLHIDGYWYLLSSDYSPKVASLYRMEKDGTRDEHWLTWINGYDLDIPIESFNTNHVANAPYIADWRRFDGHFYIIYAGRKENNSHAGRGNNKLGLARSDDLIHWEVP